jgi:hypothetical protein
MDSIGATRLSEVLREKNTGEPVNAHIVHLPPEPIPDYDAMQAVISGEKPPKATKDEGDVQGRTVSAL